MVVPAVPGGGCGTGNGDVADVIRGVVRDVVVRRAVCDDADRSVLVDGDAALPRAGATGGTTGNRLRRECLGHVHE